jgi:NADPH-dependent 2,4-dienoyl-CoA reductase/sulfur reductase-like enzyme
VERAITAGGIIETDMVIVAVGAEPNSDLARAAGLEVSPRGGIVVNSRMQTSDPDIYAGGDCVEVTNLITGKPGYYPLGSMANRQGRIIGANLAGGNSKFPGAVGSFVVKVFELSVAAAGLSSEVARSEGFDAIAAGYSGSRAWAVWVTARLAGSMRWPPFSNTIPPQKI